MNFIHSISGVVSETEYEDSIFVNKSPDHSVIITISDGEISASEQPTMPEESSEGHPVITILSSSSEDSTSSDSDSLPDVTVKHEQVDKLPFNIDGDVVYRLPYDPSKKMKSSLDGRPWKTWVTSCLAGTATCQL